MPIKKMGLGRAILVAALLLLTAYVLISGVAGIIIAVSKL